MAGRPTAFNRPVSFALFSAENPGAPHSGVQLDSVYDAVKLSLDETQVFLAAITDSDGVIKRGSIGRAQLASDIVLGVAPPELWAASTSYIADESVVFSSLKLYIANVTHTSGATFDESKWSLLADFSATAQIEDGSIVTAKLDDEAVTAGKLAANAVISLKISPLAVTTAKIANAAVTEDKIADDAVTEDKILDAAVTEDKIANNAITADKIGPNVIGASELADNAVDTAAILDAAVTFAKMASAAFGSGIEARSSVYLAPGFAPQGSFSRLVIKVLTNTTISCAANYVTTGDGSGKFQTTPLSATIDMATNGANGLDAGSIVAATWYAIYAISKEDGTTAALASASFTSPTLPTGYTRRTRIGAVRTAALTAQLLGTWQFGRVAQYVVGLAQTIIQPIVTQGAIGTISATSPTLAAVSVADVVPSTAAKISVSATNSYKGVSATNVHVGTSTAVGGSNNGPQGSNGMAYPIWLTSGVAMSASASLVLEATTIAGAMGAGGGVSCLGWEDNL